MAHTIEGLLSALKEIAKGEGVYSRDSQEHANNTIESMKRIAQEAIDGGMLTLEKLKTIAPGTIFATGEAMDNEDGVFLASTDKRIKWIAIKGHGHDDWCIYAHFATHDDQYIKTQGDKVNDPVNIRKCVPCDDEALARYRR